jgi:hypothetical protein
LGLWLSDEAKAAAVEHGLDDNRSALLEAGEKDGKTYLARNQVTSWPAGVK